MRALCDCLTPAPGDRFPCTVSLDPKQPVLMVTEGGGLKQPGMDPWEAGFSSRVAHIIQYEDWQPGGQKPLQVAGFMAQTTGVPLSEAAVQRDRNLHWPKSCFRLGNE